MASIKKSESDSGKRERKKEKKEKRVEIIDANVHPVA